MWKLIVGFIVFAALALYVISKGGDSLDMSGEKHGADVHAPADAGASSPAAPATPAASEPAATPASAASA